MNMTLNIKLVAPDFSRIEYLDTGANFCEKCFNPEFTKNNNESVAMIFSLCDVNRTNNSIKKIKGRHKIIEDFFPCALTFLFFVCLMKLKGFCVTQNDTPKMVKNVRL